MSKRLTLDKLRKGYLADHEAGCEKLTKVNISGFDRPVFVCADGRTDVESGGVGFLFNSEETPALPKRGRGRPKGTYGRRRGGYVDPRTGKRVHARKPKMTVKCDLDSDGVWWYYNDTPGSKFRGQYRCRCKTMTARGVNANFLPDSVCERVGVPKDPEISRRIEREIDEHRRSLKNSKG